MLRPSYIKSAILAGKERQMKQTRPVLKLTKCT